jgi:hypothetical protein
MAQNLLIPLCNDSLRDFARGSGGELRKARRSGARAKLLATHSSAALACNAFEYWRSREWALVEIALGLPAPVVSFNYEAQFPTGLEGEPPNLDAAFGLRDGSIWAIESKYMEPFRPSKSAVAALKEKYFPDGRPIWTERGLPACGELAAALRRGDVFFRRLDAVQLLKHALGLKMCGRRFTLAYMWLDSNTKAGEEHRSEVDRFSKAVGTEISFLPLSYQQFVTKLRLHSGPNHDPFFTYFAERYGCETRRRSTPD